MGVDPNSSQLEFQAETALAVRQCQAGDPLPLLGLCWGEVLQADEVLQDRFLPGDYAEAGIPFVILDNFQVDMIRSLFDPSVAQIWVKGNTGCGKGGAAAIGICLYYAVWADSKIVITRDSYQRARRVMMGEVRKWWHKMRWHPPGIRVGVDSLKDIRNQEHICEVVNPGSNEGFQGTHSQHVLFVFDEGTARVLEARYSLAYTQAKKLLVMGNPSTMGGSFRKAFGDDPDTTQTAPCDYGLKRLITISGEQMLNVRAECLEKPVAPPGGIEIDGEQFPAGTTIPEELAKKREPIIPGQTSYDEFQGHLRHPDPNWVACYAHGRFPQENRETQIALRSWLTTPRELWGRYQQTLRKTREQSRRGNHRPLRLLRKLFPVQALGLDVGASAGGDQSVLTVGGNAGIYNQHAEQLGDAVSLCDWIEDIISDHYLIDLRSSSAPIAIDSDGVGWGIGGILRSRGIRVLEIHGNATPAINPRLYMNARAEIYGELGLRLNPSGPYKAGEKNDIGFVVPFMFPDNEELVEELLAHHKIFSPDQIKFRVTPKRKKTDGETKLISIEEKIGRSPDRSDSAGLFYRALRDASGSLSDLLSAGAF